MSICKDDKQYYFNFLGNEEDLNKELIFKSYDSINIPLNNIPITYYPLTNFNYKNYTKDFDHIISEFKKNVNILQDKNNIYNNYNIFIITVIVCIMWILILIFCLRYLHIRYNIYYVYFIITTIILLLIFTSLWFLYVNNDLI